MPLVVELDAGVDVPPGLLQAPGYVGQLFEPLRGKGGNEVEGEGLEKGQNGADFTQLIGSQRPDPEAPSHFGVQGAFPRQTNQCLPDRCSANAELLCDLAVPDAATRCKSAALNAFQQIEIDLIPQGRSGEHSHSEVGEYKISNT